MFKLRDNEFISEFGSYGYMHMRLSFKHIGDTKAFDIWDNT